MYLVCVVGSGSVPPGRAQGTGESQTKCFLYVLQARVAFLQGERKGQENLKQDLVRRIKMLEFALKQERSVNYRGPAPACTQCYHYFMLARIQESVRYSKLSFPVWGHSMSNQQMVSTHPLGLF